MSDVVAYDVLDDVVVVNAVVDMACDVAFVVEAPCGFEVVVVAHTDVDDKALHVVAVVDDAEVEAPFHVRFLF